MKNIALLGSTGSIGTQSIDILSRYDDFNIIALTCNTNVDKMYEQHLKLKPKYVVIMNERAYLEQRDRFSSKVLYGLEGIYELMTYEDIDIVINAIIGNIGLMPTIHAIKNKKNVAIANKESLVTSGKLIMDLARTYNVKILPIDSEHSAIFQALRGNKLSEIERVILTASGGPFRELSYDEIKTKKAVDALKHPNWSMGRKITIDSATLMNKGLEVIEAKWLYDLDISQIDVIVHPESMIHSMVEYIDKSIIAQMSRPTMLIPILYALSYPERKKTDIEPVDFETLSSLHFSRPRYEDFPCLSIAFDAIKKGGLLPTVMNASNEELVYKYLKDEIGFYDIPKYIEKAMAKFDNRKLTSIEEVLEYDTMSREYIRGL